jgi:Rps23 Pro-64 3,4-dihydroxylase Tpa1-like proline 4-hydroxylase
MPGTSSPQQTSGRDEVVAQFQRQFAELLIDKLRENKEALRAQWANPIGTTTRSLVLDDLLPTQIRGAIYAGFPQDAGGFHRLNTFRERKKTSVDLSNYDPILEGIVYAFQDPRLVQLVGEIVGIRELEPDPILYAGGVSMMLKDDFLNPHLDNSHDARRQRYRRLNLLYYVSPDWTIENGGNFELWDTTRTHPKVIVSRTNRLVVMETTKTSWHSVNKVIADRPRCCVSSYYFSQISPDATSYYHVTSFMGRPEERFRQVLGIIDNGLRNLISKTLKITTGKVRKDKQGK